MRLLLGGIGWVLLTGMAIAADAQQSGSVVPVAVQDTLRRPQVRKPLVKKPKPLRTELSGGLRLNTNGWSLFAEKGWVKEGEERESDLFYNLKTVQIEFSEVKHPKEMKQTNEGQGMYSDKPRPFIYGKINNFYTLNLGYGFRRMIAGKPERGAVSVHWFGTGGLSLGMLKPYYVDAYVPQDNGGRFERRQIKYEDSSNGAFLNERLVIGGAGITKGLNEIKFVPGLQAKTGLHFDFASGKKTVMAIEIGIHAAYYTQKIEIMADQKAFPYNLNAFAGIQFGKRW